MSQASVSTSQLIENTKTNVNALGGSWQVIISQYKGPALKSNLTAKYTYTIILTYGEKWLVSQ